MSTATVQEADDAHDGGSSPAMHERVLEAVGIAIASAELPPGSRLTLEGLQQEYGISRTVARDTMKVLESMNLVYSRRRVGIVVQERSMWNVFDPKLVRWRLASDRREIQYSSLTELRIAVERARDIAKLAVDTRGERRLGEARADRSRDVGGARARRHLPHRTVGEADLEHFRHANNWSIAGGGAMAQATALRKTAPPRAVRKRIFAPFSSSGGAR